MALRNIVLEPQKFGLDLGDLPDEPTSRAWRWI